MRKNIVLFFTCVFLFAGMQECFADRIANPPPQINQTRPALAACAGLSLYLDSAGVVWAWGQVGLPGIKQTSVPVPVLTKGVRIAASLRAAFVVRSDGTLWAWGQNDRLSALWMLPGIPQKENEPIAPTRIMDNVFDVRAGFGNASVLKQDHTLWQWGNLQPQRGITQRAPFKVMNNISQVRQGAEHTLALDKDGQLWAWGSNLLGALGLGHSNIKATDKPQKVRQAALRKKGRIVDFFCDYWESMAVLSDGSVWRWGKKEGDTGRLITHSMDTFLYPTRISGIGSVKKAEFLSDSGFLFLKNDKSLWILGDNIDGQGAPRIGGVSLDGADKVADEVENFATHYMTVTGASALFRKSDGTLWAWGNNHFGQLGDGTTENRETPVRVQFPDGARPLCDPPLVEK